MEELEKIWVDEKTGITHLIGVYNYDRTDWEIVSKPFSEPIENCEAFKPFRKQMAIMLKELDVSDAINQYGFNSIGAMLVSKGQKIEITNYDETECPNLAELERKQKAWAKRC